MAEKEGRIKVYTENEEAKRTIFNVLQEETGIKFTLPKGTIELEQSVYDETTVRMLQQLILKEQISFMTLEPVNKVKKGEKSEKKEKKEEKKSRKQKVRVRNVAEKIMEYLDVHKQATNKELVEYTGACGTAIGNNLRQMLKENKVVKIKNGLWGQKDFYNQELDMTVYQPIMEYIMGKGNITETKILEEYPEREVRFVLKELLGSGFLTQNEKERYEVSTRFRVWYFIKKNPNVQWDTIKVKMAERLVDTNTLSAALNGLVRDKKIKKDGKRGYVVV